jgi:hypothetical protein
MKLSWLRQGGKLREKPELVGVETASRPQTPDRLNKPLEGCESQLLLGYLRTLNALAELNEIITEE